MKPKKKICPFFDNGYFIKIWKITSIWVLVLFWYMVRKALFDAFVRSKWNFLIFGNSKHNWLKTEKQIWGKTFLAGLHGLITYESSATHSCEFRMRQFKDFFLKLSKVICSCSFRLINVINDCYTLKTQGGNTFRKNNSVSFVSSFLIGRALRHIRNFSRMQDFSSNIIFEIYQKEVKFGRAICTTLAIHLYHSGH
jgi:hypothetical protein